MFEWIITDMKTKRFFITTEPDSTKIYHMCRAFILSRGYEATKEIDYLNELAHSYSQNRRFFGVKNILDVISRKKKD